MATRDNKGRFVKGNKARTNAKQKDLKNKKKLSDMDMLQVEIYNESLKQLLEALKNGELDMTEVIRVNSNLAEMVTPKAKVGRPKKTDLKSKVNELKNLLGE